MLNKALALFEPIDVLADQTELIPFPHPHPDTGVELLNAGPHQQANSTTSTSQLRFIDCGPELRSAAGATPHR